MRYSMDKFVVTKPFVISVCPFLLEQIAFSPESVEPMVFEVIESVLRDKVYQEGLVQGWIDEICCRISKNLIDSNKPYKYLGGKFDLTLI